MYSIVRDPLALKRSIIVCKLFIHQPLATRLKDQKQAIWKGLPVVSIAGCNYEKAGSYMSVIPPVSATQFDTEVQLIVPVLTRDTLTEGVQKWIEKNSKYWPGDLTAAQIAQSIPVIYLPYWAVSGSGSATWYASIGVDRDVLKRCSTCDGRGRYTPIWSTDEQRCGNCAGSGKALGKETFWNNQSGHAEADFNGVLVDNFDEKSLNLQIGKRDFKADWRVVSDSEKVSTSFVSPLATTKSAAKQAAEKTLITALERDATADGYRLGDYVRNVKLANISASRLSSAAFGYPVYLGFYQHNGKQYRTEADGVTGKFWVQKPEEVVKGNDRDTTKLALIMIGLILAMLVAYLAYIAYAR